MNPTLKETYRSSRYHPDQVKSVNAQYCGSDPALRRRWKFFEIDGKNMTVREYHTDGRELSKIFRNQLIDAHQRGYPSQLRWMVRA